jgi:type IV secretion system protein VirB11
MSESNVVESPVFKEKTRTRGVLVHELKRFEKWLEDPSINEISINDNPHEIWLWRAGKYELVIDHDITMDYLNALANLIGNWTDNHLSESNTSISGELPDGERIEITIPPGCPKNTIYFNIRKHRSKSFELMDFFDQGYFENTTHAINLTVPDQERARLEAFINEDERELYEYAKKGDWFKFLVGTQQLSGFNGAISGTMGTGKTTFLNTLADLIDDSEVIITVEDSQEIQLTHHKNKKQLFFKRGQDNRKEKMGATPTEALLTTLRKTPDRILFGELRGSEAINFVEDVGNIGLNGTLTTIHASSSRLAFTRIASLIKRSEQGKVLNYEEIYDLIYPVVHFIVHIKYFKKENKRRVTEIYFDPIYSLYRLGM